MSEQRDAKLGARLDELEVREHGEDYWSAVMAAVEPELGRQRDVKLGSRPGGFAAFADRHPTFGGGFKWWATAAVAAAVAIVVLLAGLPVGLRGTSPLGPQPATAAEAIRSALGSLDSAQALEGTLYVGKVREGNFAAGDKVTFLCARDGSFRITSENVGPDALYPLPGYVETIAYDADARIARGVFDYGDQGFQYESTTQDPTTEATVTTTTVQRFVYTELHDVAPGPPDARLYGTAGFPVWQVRAYLRTMLGDPEIEFRVGELDGQTVWLLSTEAFASGSSGAAAKGSPVTIVIDARTRLPLRMTGYRGDYEVRMDSAALRDEPATSEFTVEKPPAEETQDQSEMGLIDVFTRFPGLPFSDQAGMSKAVGDVPAFPGWVPRDFARRTGASQTNGWVDLPRASGAPRKSIRNTIVSLAFRRGFDAAYVSARPDSRLNHQSMIGLPGEDEARIRVDTSDPFIGDVTPWDRAQWQRHTTEVRLAAGAFKGATAHVIVDPGYWPHLWVKKDGWVATVAGDLTRAQMVRIAESLGPWSAEAVE